MHSRHRLGAATLAAAVSVAAIAVAGCGSSSAPTASTATAASAARRAAGGCASDLYRCTRIWFQNDTGNWVKVTARGHDQGPQGVEIASGKQGSITGYSGGWGESDISSGEVHDTGNRGYYGFRARNPQVGAPSIGFWSANHRDEEMVRFSVGETRSFSVPGYRVFEVTRNPDTNHFIEFSVRYHKE